MVQTRLEKGKQLTEEKETQESAIVTSQEAFSTSHSNASQPLPHPNSFREGGAPRD